LYAGVKDEESALWLYSRCGLVSIAAPQLSLWQQNQHTRIKVETLDIYDGVQPGITPLQPQATRSLDGRLWFANNNIMQTVNPKTRRRNALAPNVIVERVVADDVSYPLQQGFKLPALVDNLEIDFTALSFVAPQKVRFRYKLEGHDSEWTDSQGRRQAFYTNLSPRNYRFRVMACNNSGVWNEAGASLDFSVARAYYQTLWPDFMVPFVVPGRLCLIALDHLSTTPPRHREAGSATGFDEREVGGANRRAKASRGGAAAE
jgi:hypothetical protein